MDFFQYFHRDSRREEFVECRQCGTTIDASDNRCPQCGSTEIARYEI